MRRPLLCGLDPIGSKPHSRGPGGGQGSSPPRRGMRGWPKRVSLLHLRRPSESRPMRRRLSRSRPPSLPRRLQAASRQPSRPSPGLEHLLRPPRRPHLRRPPRQPHLRRPPRQPHLRRPPRQPHRLLRPRRPHLHRRPNSQPNRRHPRPANRHTWSGCLPHRLLSSRHPSSPHATLSSLLTWSGSRFPVRSPFSPRPLCSVPNHPCFLLGRRYFAFLRHLPP